MKLIVLVTLSSLLYLIVAGFAMPSQNDELSKCLNLNFEQKASDGSAFHWWTKGAYEPKLGRFLTVEEEGDSVTLDSTVVHSGKYSLAIHILPTGLGGSARFDFEPCCKMISKNLIGKRVTLKGWIKMKDITNFAGFFLGGYDDKTSYNFDNMYDSVIHGTRDWHQYSLTLPISDSATSISFGVITGSRKGTIWFDDLSIDTNGIPYIH